MPEPSVKPRVMLDANVLFAGLLWPRWPYEVLQHGIHGDIRLVLTPLVVEQVRQALSARFAGELERFEAFLRQLSYEEAPDPAAADVAQSRHLVRDPTDVPVALAAIQAQVDYLVSEDKDLTVHDETTKRLRERLTVMLSGTFLREVMAWSSEDLESVRGRTWRDLESEG